MDAERKLYLQQLAERLGVGRRLASTSLCLSAPYQSLVWRIEPKNGQGVILLIVGRDQQSAEHVLLQHVQHDIWELFANTPLDPFGFTEDPNQE